MSGQLVVDAVADLAACIRRTQARDPETAAARMAALASGNPDCAPIGVGARPSPASGVVHE